MKNVELISFCSSFRSDQAAHAIKAMEAGKHVYAEKPVAMTEDDLNKIIATSEKTGKIFHEMGGTGFSQPYMAMRKVVESGVLGEIIQVINQKSYPWFDTRPQDENIDGGLGLQVGVYNVRFVEHITGIKVKTISSKETKLGNPKADGECRRAVSFIMELENGGLCSAVSNYLCPGPDVHGKWGYETVRIFGVNGYVESIDNGRITNLVLSDKDCGPLDISEPSVDYFEMFTRELNGENHEFPSLEDELHPTRMVIRAKAAL